MDARTSEKIIDENKSRNPYLKSKASHTDWPTENQKNICIGGSIENNPAIDQRSNDLTMRRISLIRQAKSKANILDEVWKRQSVASGDEGTVGEPVLVFAPPQTDEIIHEALRQRGRPFNAMFFQHIYLTFKLIMYNTSSKWRRYWESPLIFFFG